MLQQCTLALGIFSLTPMGSPQKVPFKGGSKARAALSQSVESVLAGTTLLLVLRTQFVHWPQPVWGHNNARSATFKEQGMEGADFTGYSAYLHQRGL